MVVIWQELGELSPNNEVFKLIGPVLVKQDQDEARANVDKRLEFIRSELCAPLHVILYHLRVLM